MNRPRCLCPATDHVEKYFWWKIMKHAKEFYGRDCLREKDK